MYCVKCGNKLNKNDKFCTKCGNSVVDNYNIQINNNKNNNDNLSIILGIISLVTFWMPIVSIVCAIIAIVSGKKYKNSTNNSSSGVVLGVFGLVLSILTILFIIFMLMLAIFAVDNGEVIENKVHEYTDKFDDKNGDSYDKDDDSREKFTLNGIILQGTDKSVLYLNNDNTYSWYMNDSVHDDNYYSGTYSYYNGLEAVNYIIKNFSEYGLTYDKQMDLFEKGNYNIDDYYVLVLNCNDVVINGKSDDKSKGIIPYYGFYDDDEDTLSLVNMKTGNKANFTISGKPNKKGFL